MLQVYSVVMSLGTVSRRALAIVALASVLPLVGCDPDEEGLPYAPTVPPLTQIDAQPAEFRIEPSIAVRAGVIHMAWLQQRVGLNVNSVWYSFAPVGANFATEMDTNRIEMTSTLAAADDASGAVVGVGPTGDVTVVWSEGQVGSRSIAFATKPTGQALFGPTAFLIRGDDTTPAVDNANPTLHYDDNGALHFAWEAGSDIKYRQRPLSGTLANVQVLNNAGGGQTFTAPSNPSVMTDELENVMVAFEATQNVNGSTRRVARVAASNNGGGTFNLVGFLGGAGQQVVAGLFQPTLIRVAGAQQVAAVVRIGNERDATIQFARYLNLGAAINGGTITELREDTAPVGSVSGVRSPVAGSWFNAERTSSDIWVAWNDYGTIRLRASLDNGDSWGEEVTVSTTGGGNAGSTLRPAIAVQGNQLAVAWDAQDAVNSVRALFIAPFDVTNRYTVAEGN